MNYKYLADKELNSFLKFRIIHNQKFKTYMINDKWVNEINEAYYTQIIEDLKNKITKQLKFGLKPLEYLKDILQSTENRIDQLENYALNSFEFFKSYGGKILASKTDITEPTPNDGFFEIFKKTNDIALEQNPELVGYLNFYSRRFDDLQTKEDFEKGILLYAICIYKDALWDLHGFIYKIHMNAEFTDFKSIDIDGLMVENEKSLLGHFNLSKKEVAHLFRILLEEEFLVFDEKDDSKNKLTMKRFVEDSFTFQNLKKERSSIKTFNREYSEVCSNLSADVKVHKDFIDVLISKLQARKDKLKN